MTENPMPFDHRPDPVLGAALRQALDPGDHAAFVARVMAGAGALRPGAAGAPTLEVLAGWAVRGITVAAAALLAGFLMARSFQTPVAVEEAFASPTDASATTALLSGQRPLDASVVFATMVEH